MQPFFKVKSLLTADGQAVKIEILEKHPALQGNYGMEYPYDIKVDDKALFRWNASQNQEDRIKELGLQTFMLKRWDKGVKTGFNFCDPADISVQPQNLGPAINIAKVAQTVNTQQEDTQERILRGMIFNNACNLLAGKDHKNIIADVKFLSEKLYTEMKLWLTNAKEVVHDKDEFKHGPAKKEIDPKSDLPF